jgi:hypothetical protein
MHNGREEFRKTGKLSCVISQLTEQLSKCGKIFCVVVSFDSSIFDFFFKLSKRISVCTLAAFQETKNSFDLNRLQLSVDGVEIIRFVFPELKFNSGPWIFSILKSLFRFKF